MADNPEKETFNSDKLAQAPKETLELAKHAAVDIVNLAAVVQTAPPQLHPVLNQIGSTMAQLATHVFATLEEGPECARRIEARRDKMNDEIEELSAKVGAQRDALHRGDVMQQMFRDPGRQPIGFRHNRDEDKHVN